MFFPSLKIHYFIKKIIKHNNEKLCCGIDVSQNTLDVAYQNNLGEIFHIKVGNNNKGFETIMEHTGHEYDFVMEATGVYYVRLAFFFHSNNCTMRGKCIKDKNAIYRCNWRKTRVIKRMLNGSADMLLTKSLSSEMPDSMYFESKQLYNTIRQYSEEIKRFNNQLHSLRILPVQNKETIKSLEKMKLQFEKEIKILELKLEALLIKWKPDQVKNIGSIKAIGRRATAMLIIYTQGFKYTENHRQLISFAGLSPKEYGSGTVSHRLST